MELKNYQDAVEYVLTNDVKSRSNDIRLTRLVLHLMGYPTDFVLLEAQTSSNVFETISRARRKVQKVKPFLAVDRTKARRAAMEEEFKEWSRGL